MAKEYTTRLSNIVWPFVFEYLCAFGFLVSGFGLDTPSAHPPGTGVCSWPHVPAANGLRLYEALQDFDDSGVERSSLTKAAAESVGVGDDEHQQP